MILVVALLIQQKTGGSLAELLERLAETVRARVRLHGKVRTLTAEGRFQAVVLVLLPPLLFATLLVIHPVYAMTLFDYPGLILATAGAMAVGALWIRRIISVDV